MQDRKSILAELEALADRFDDAARRHDCAEVELVEGRDSGPIVKFIWFDGRDDGSRESDALREFQSLAENVVHRMAQLGVDLGHPADFTLLRFVSDNTGGEKVEIIFRPSDGWRPGETPNIPEVHRKTLDEPFRQCAMAIGLVVAEQRSRSQSSYDLVTIGRVAEMVKKSPRTVENYVSGWPEPVVTGAGNRPHKWSYRAIYPTLVEQCGDREIPEPWSPP